MKRMLLGFVAAVFILGICSAYSGELKVAEGTLALWHFNESSDKTLYDETGKLDGELTNMTGKEWTAGKFGNCLEFNGKDNYVLTYSKFPMSQPNLTVEAWVKPSGIDGDRVIVACDGYWVLSLRNGFPNFLVWDNGTNQEVRGKDRIKPGQWRHVAAVYEGGKRELKVYLDGVLSGEMVYQGGKGATHDNSYEVSIGCDSANAEDKRGYFAGCIDELRVTSLALSPGKGNGANEIGWDAGTNQ